MDAPQSLLEWGGGQCISNFARLTFHGNKMTHVETNGIFSSREGECVAMRVSKSKS